ncbi:hypothetical protein E0H73_40100 [Kribbella pittospori]|uniref:ImmA/IrrE family metallo-endopeptidase n=1 Tax=Kribbella pittospori TaxID=722689 RepID=A0A4V2M8N2_9ACTN|nr:hypothetical protein [Kribbella pittospori]TCC52142.1 hypothetical protein E0H73_40100 [Kribbella pittospori]
MYDVTDTVGPPIHLPRTPAPGRRIVPNGLWDALAREASTGGFTVGVQPIGDASEGFTDYFAKQIVVADHLDDVTAVARLAHEVGHMRMHSAPDMHGAESITCRGVREVEAESVAYVVLAHHGLSIEASSFDYIAGWARTVEPEEPASVIKATGARVVNTARQLIDSTDRYLKAIGRRFRQSLRDPSSLPSSRLTSTARRCDLGGVGRVMGASERVAALQRARQRQARIEVATARTIRAQASLDRAIEAKARAIEQYDERVANAEAVSAAEAAELANVCGSAEAAAEILGWSVRDLRRVVKAERERRTQPTASARDRVEHRAKSSGGGADVGST